MFFTIFFILSNTSRNVIEGQFSDFQRQDSAIPWIEQTKNKKSFLFLLPVTENFYKVHLIHENNPVDLSSDLLEINEQEGILIEKILTTEDTFFIHYKKNFKDYLIYWSSNSDLDFSSLHEIQNRLKENKYIQQIATTDKALACLIDEHLYLWGDQNFGGKINIGIKDLQSHYLEGFRGTKLHHTKNSFLLELTRANEKIFFIWGKDFFKDKDSIIFKYKQNLKKIITNENDFLFHFKLESRKNILYSLNSSIPGECKNLFEHEKHFIKEIFPAGEGYIIHYLVNDFSKIYPLNFRNFPLNLTNHVFSGKIFLEKYYYLDTLSLFFLRDEVSSFFFRIYNKGGKSLLNRGTNFYFQKISGNQLLMSWIKDKKKKNLILNYKNDLDNSSFDIFLKKNLVNFLDQCKIIDIDGENYYLIPSRNDYYLVSVNSNHLNE